MKTRPSHRTPNVSKGQFLLATPAFGALAVAPAAHAAVIYTNPGTHTIGPGGSTYLWFNFVTGAVGSSGSQAYLRFYVGSSNLPYGDIFDVGANSIAISGAPSHLYVTNFPYGSSINASLFEGVTIAGLNKYGNNDAFWSPGTTGYIGYQFTDGSNTDYAWAQISYNSDKSLSLYGFAYDNTGSPIAAGAVPEPAVSAALAAVLAGSMVAFRARQNRKIQKAA